MRKIQRVLFFVLVLSLGLFISSCMGKKYNVTFNANGGELTSKEVLKVNDGSLVKEPTEPTRVGYKFLGWFISEDEGETFVLKWEFDSRKVETNITLYAKWELFIEKDTPIAIKEVLKAPANQELMTEGIVYFADGNGIYISDGNDKLFVETNETVALKDKVTVKGKVEILGKKVYLKADEVEIEDSNQEALKATELSIKDITLLNPNTTEGNWYSYYKVSGFLTYNNALKEYSVKSEVGNDELLLVSTSFDLTNYVGERIYLNVLLSEYDVIKNTWKATLEVNSITEKNYTKEELTAILMPYFETEILDEVLGGGLTLPAKKQDVNGLTITWETTIPNYIDILPLDENALTYKTSIVIPDEDVEGKLIATVKYKDLAPFTLEVDILVKTLVKTSLKQAITDKLYRSLFDAVVVGFAEGQNLTFKSYIIQDLNDPSVVITVDYYSSSDFGSYIDNVKVGDILTFTAQYSESNTGRPYFNQLETALTGETVVPNYDLENATVLDEQGWMVFPGHNKFVKLVNPYLQYSTSSTPLVTNWVRISPYADRMTGDYGQIGARKTLAFLIRPLDDLMGIEWRNSLKIPTTSGEPIQYEGSIYGFVIYESDSYFQFVAVSKDHFIPSDRLIVEDNLRSMFSNKVEEGDLTLLKTHDLVDGNIVWTSTHADIIDEDGKINYPEVDTNITLTASYTIKETGAEITIEIAIVVVGKVRVVLEVSEALKEVDDSIFNIGGYVVQVGYTNSTTSPSTSFLNEVFIQDRITGELMIAFGLADLYSDNEINIGDEIEFFARLSIDAENKIIVTYIEDLRVINTNVELLDYKANAITITDHNHANQIFGEKFHYGQVYHMSGAVYFNSTTTLGNLFTNLRYHLNPTASALTDVQMANRSLVFNLNGNRPILGENFVEELFDIEGNPDTVRPGLKRNIDFYFVVISSSASYFYTVALNPEDIVLDVPTTIIEDVKVTIPEELLVGDLTLVSEHRLLTEDITWVSSNEAIIDLDGKVTYPSDEEIVTLTFTFNYKGESYSEDINVTVKAAPAMSVKDILEEAETGEIVFVEGIIVGFHWNGSSTVGSLTNGVMIKDATGNDILYVVGLFDNYGSEKFEYTVGGQILAKGDKIKFVATYEISTTEGHTGRKTLVIESAEIANLEIVAREVEYSYNLEEAEVISDQEGLQNLAENLEYGKLYKLTGNFGFRGSASAYGTAVNLQVSYVRTAATDYNMTPSWATGDGTANRGQRFSFKFDGNVPNLGEKWYEDLLGINSDTYTGTNNAGMSFEEGAYIYFYIGHALPRAASSNGYLQLAIFETDWISATLK